MKDMKDRMVFLERHGDDPRSRNVSVPAFLSGLTEVELAFVRSKVEQTPAEASAYAAHE
jgi:hypothetical protein